MDISGLILPDVIQEICNNVLTKQHLQSIDTTITRAQYTHIYNTALHCPTCMSNAGGSTVSSIRCYNGNLQIK